MERERFTPLGIAYVLVIVSIAIAPLALWPGTAVADNHAAAAPYSIVQGGQCTPIWPRGDGNATGAAYYDYRSPSTDPTGQYSSYGTTDLQASNVSQLYVYRGSDGDSLVVVHDELGDDRGGGAVSFNVTGLPSEGTWTVEDDTYPTQDDRFVHGETTSRMHWMWDAARTDGGVFLGLGAPGWETITIDPAFGAESWAATRRPGAPWPHASEGPDRWIVRDGTGETRRLDTSQPVSISKGTCGGASPVATLNVTTPATAGRDVTLDATASTDPDGDVDEYRWDVDGDGILDETTDDGTTTHTYESGGTYEPTVTVVDENGNADTATASVTVQAADSPPTAAFTVNESSPTVGRPITLDASASSDDSGNLSYSWAFGDGDAGSGRTVTRAYARAGNYTVTLTVTDEAGNADMANETARVREAAPPLAADVAVNDSSPAPGQAIELAASNATGNVTSYAWDFGDGETATGATVTHAYAAPGNYSATLAVTDDAGDRASASTVVRVEDETPPVPSLSVPSTATAGNAVRFDATNSSDDVGVVEYRWHFDDGSDDATTTAGTTSHAYGTPGTYAPAVTVVDAAGNTGTANAAVVVEGGESAAAFAINDTSPTVGQSIGLRATGSTADPANTSYAWDFGDGETAMGRNVTHGYDAAGEYVVSLSVALAGGGSNSSTRSITVANETDDGGDSSGGGDGSDDSNGGSSGSSGGRSGGSGGGGGGSGASDPGDDDEQSRIVVRDVAVDRDRVPAGASVAVTVAVENAGDAAGSETVELAVDGRVVDERTVTLDDGESTQVEFTARLDAIGDRTLAVAGWTATVAVEPAEPDLSVIDVRLENETTRVGQRATLLVTLANDGGRAGQRSLNLRVFGEVVDRKTVHVPPGERRTVRFAQRFDSPGTYEVEVAGRAVGIEVTGESTPSVFTIEEPGGADRIVSLGYLGVGGLALAGAVIFVSRRL